MPLDQKTLKGKIDYIHDETGERGREWFAITVQPDGVRTMRAQCEMDDGKLLRDVVYSVDGAWQPLDAYVRLTQNGEFKGGSWFRFEDHFIDCEGYTAREGRLSQRVAVDRRPPTFAPHPVAMDAWQTNQFDLSRPGEIQAFEGCANSSPAADGGTGPMIGLQTTTLEYLGDETLTVPAGTFETGHYRFHSELYTPFDIWSRKGDFTFVRLYWGHLKTRYDLVEFEEG
jgi:hypothetical protein